MTPEPEAPTVRLSGTAAEVALAEAQAVLARVEDGGRRDRLADLVAAVQEGELAAAEAEALEEVIELGLATGRIRGHYGPEGEQAVLATYRRLPRGKELAAGAREVTEALAVLQGRTLDQVKVHATGPGAYVLTLGVDGLEVAVRLDRTGARVHSIGT